MIQGLKIGYDGKRAIMNYTGIGNYSRLALESLVTLAPDNRFILFTPRLKENPRMTRLNACPQVEVRLPDTLRGRVLPHLWRSSGLTAQLRREGVDLYHGLSNELPSGLQRADIPSVVTIHDLIFRRHPEFYHRADVRICDAKFSAAARQATRVMAISDRTRLDLIELYGIPDEKIDVVYQGCAPIFHRPVSAGEIASVRRKYNLPAEYIIGVGTIESRKNQLLTVRAMAALPADLGLVLVGRRTDYALELDREIARQGIGHRVRFIEGAPMEDIPALYAGAIISSYPSFYEGFGIPMLESIAAGTPVVAATGSCLEEAGGPGALYVNPRSVEEFAHAATRLLDSPTLREEMVTQGREYIARFAPENFGRGILECYEKTLASR